MNKTLTAAERATITDACQSISRSADALTAGCSIDGEWPDADDKAFYEGELRVLERLVALLNDPGQPEPFTVASLLEWAGAPDTCRKDQEQRAEVTDDDKVCAERYRCLRGRTHDEFPDA